MNKLNRWAAAAVAVVMVIAMAAPAVAGEMTVGSFVQKLAVSKNLVATDADSAASALATAGVRLPADLDYNQTLTEGEVVRIARAAGLRLTTNNPTDAFGDNQVDQFFAAFAVELGSGDADGDASTRSNNGNGLGGTFDPFSKGKGKGKGKNDMTPTEPE